MISEIEFFNDIFEDFPYQDNHKYENDLWKANSIIKLMHNSDGFIDKSIIEEGLKIIISLCRFNECGVLLDSYELESYPINQLIESEKKLIESILKAEFI
ncbi:MAG: hypothetical protein ACFFC3_15930 [Candidatus Odinarchaeota archaeon]